MKKDSVEDNKNTSVLENNEYPGIVKIIIPGRTKGTDVFVAPDILVTDFHICKIKKLNRK